MILRIRHFFLLPACCLLLNCTSMALSASADNYPDEWWTPVPAEQLAPWEIGPQAADRKKGEVILSKRNELGLLSNFAPAPFTFRGQHFASVEGLWQSLKYPENPQDERYNPMVTWPYTRAQVEQMTAFEAKDAGKIANQNMKKLRIDWVSFQGEKIHYQTTDQKAHYELIFYATSEKILQNSNVKEVLLKTGNLNLLPDHQQGANDPPAYGYNLIAMKIRLALQKGDIPKP